MLKALKKLLSKNPKYDTPTSYEIDINILSKLWITLEEKPQINITPLKEISTKTPSFSAYDAIKDIIDPIESIIKSKGCWEGFINVLSTVEKYGNYPSVVLSSDRIEYRNEVLNILSNITIKEHSVKVVRIMVDELKEHYKDINALVFIAVLAGLMHDIGKAEPLRNSPQYSKYDHPLISADVLKSCFTEEVYDVNKAVEIIRNHHKPSSDLLLSIFQQADEKARIEELKLAQKLVVEITDAFSPGDIINAIEPDVNVPVSERDWRAFSFRDVVYVEPDYLYNLLLQLSESKNIILVGQVKTISKPLFLKNVFNILKNAKMIANIALSHEYFGWFEISTGNFSRKMMLIPIEISAFGKLPSYFEERKLTQSRSGSLKFIKSVVPSKISKK